MYYVRYTCTLLCTTYSADSFSSSPPSDNKARFLAGRQHPCFQTMSINPCGTVCCKVPIAGAFIFASYPCCLQVSSLKLVSSLGFLQWADSTRAQEYYNQSGFVDHSSPTVLNRRRISFYAGICSFDVYGTKKKTRTLILNTPYWKSCSSHGIMRLHRRSCCCTSGLS